jgi:hypothetical protein
MKMQKESILNFYLLCFCFISSIIYGESLSDFLSQKTTAGFHNSSISVSEGSGNSALVTLDSTNLPLVLIDTGGKNIPDEPKITARMKVIDHENGFNKPADTEVEYDGYIGIEIRGHSSAYYPQKPYNLETRDSLGNNLNVSLMGMPKENDWVLISNFNDKSFVRNILSFELFNRMGHYATRARLCEVMINSIYRGIYVFCEKIKPDKNRVNIVKLTPENNTENSLTGGYIISIDYHDGSDSWRSNYPAFYYPDKKVYYVYVDPKPDELTIKQKSYIQGFIRKAEGALYGNNYTDPEIGYRKFIDVPSFIDYFILGEVSRSVDAYKKSRFFFKNRNDIDSLLYAGPVWDFDWAWKNITECIYSNTNGANWSYKTNSCNPDNNAPDWYIRLLQDGYFTNKLIERYQSLRKDFLNLENIYHQIDSLTTLVDEACVRHFALYPINGVNSAPEVEPPSETYEEEISRLKEWISKRLVWLDANFPKLRSNITGTEVTTTEPSNFLLSQNYPNPFNPTTQIKYFLPMNSIVTLKVYNLLGEKVKTLIEGFKKRGNYTVTFDASGLSSGIYLYRMTAHQREGGQAENFTDTKKTLFLK